MKLNMRFVMTLYRHVSNENLYEYGFYYGGRAFFACNGELTEPDPLLQEAGIDFSGKRPTLKDMVIALAMKLNGLGTELPY